MFLFAKVSKYVKILMSPFLYKRQNSIYTVLDFSFFTYNISWKLFHLFNKHLHNSFCNGCITIDLHIPPRGYP